MTVSLSPGLSNPLMGRMSNNCSGGGLSAALELPPLFEDLSVLAIELASSCIESASQAQQYTTSTAEEFVMQTGIRRVVSERQEPNSTLDDSKVRLGKSMRPT